MSARVDDTPGSGLWDGPDGSALTAEALRQLVEFLYRRTGMLFGAGKRYYVDRRVAERMAATKHQLFSEYFLLLRGDPRELEIFINAFTINETYFYREDYQLRCLSSTLLPIVTAGRAPGELVRIWSMPCSTGEEPFSIAIWLLENWGLVDAYNVEIVGSDINTQSLAEARAGLYGERSLSRLSPDLVDNYFQRQPDGTWRIIWDLEESVNFTAANLIDAESMAAQGEFDIVFCRNVLIYFDDASRQAAAENLRRSLRRGGFLCLGHSESMSRINDRFETCRFEDAIVYRRPLKDT
jgi:chemotaxis protein methyltransferase CheR